MIQTDLGWRYEVNRGPDWIFVRLRPCDDGGVDSSASLADRLWSVLDQCFTYRLVLELDEVPIMQSYLIGQLVQLAKRISAQGGMLRLCGLSPANQEVIRLCRLDGCLPLYGSRSDAVMGRSTIANRMPAQPR